MKKIIVGCLYGDIGGLKKSLSKKVGNDCLIDVENVLAVDFDNVYVGKGYKKHPIKSFTSAYIRYPYDLIPPHSETYQKREYTEFFKTIALLFNSISINKIDKNFNSRNRLYSLKIAESCGLKIPKSLLIKGKKYNFKNFNNKTITKSIGNCFYSADLEDSDKIKKRFLSYEKDGDDSAYVYLPHKINSKKDVDLHVGSFGVILLQDGISGDEYRVYIIGQKIFSYKRDRILRFDKSFSELLNENYDFEKSDIKKLMDLKLKLELNYLCLDIIVCKKGIYVIDINPFGALPEYGSYPEATDELANLMLSK